MRGFSSNSRLVSNTNFLCIFLLNFYTVRKNYQEELLLLVPIFNFSLKIH